ncbi:MAG: hypothetical protein WBL53_22940 [Pseudonocardiaceae bacterium]
MKPLLSKGGRLLEPHRLVIGSLLGGVIANSRAGCSPPAAGLYLSHRGFYLHTDRVLTWGWDDITTATMAKPGAVQIRGNSVHGPVAWALCSDWAELLFITWALTRHPRHPQLLNGQWLPPGRVDHAHTHHQPVPLTSLGLPPYAETRGPPRMTTSAFLS